ncbi:hypothetical protein ACH5RR_035876 [Cinchona calisaya]|uniref:Uncharacterized protein n=1 Tax=Cinchona calisaya TaxID=153742 RepID=A0ABD2Y4S4_9GENT
MAGCALHLIVTFLAFSSLVPFNVVATSRAISLLNGSHDIQALDDINQITTGEIAEEEFNYRRMDFESRDYPGPGANNRHKPPPGGD